MRHFWSNKDKTKKRINIPYEFQEQLAKIVGAHLPDGYLQKSGLSYQIKVSDGRKDTIEIFRTWLKEVFNLDSRIRFNKGDNTWNAWYSSKIIGRFFENIFEIDAGKKAYSVREPIIIKNSHLKIRNAFVLGVMTFDGGVKTSGIISISSMSKKLIEDLEEIFQLNGLNTCKEYNLKKKSWLLESKSGRRREDLSKWLNYFEHGSWKYHRLNFFLRNKSHSLSDLEELFPRHHLCKICLSDVYAVLKKIKKGKIRDLILELDNRNSKIANTTIYKYLFILEKAGLIIKEDLVTSFQNYGQREIIYTVK